MISACIAGPTRAFFILTHLIDVIYETTTRQMIKFEVLWRTSTHDAKSYFCQ